MASVLVVTKSTWSVFALRNIELAEFGYWLEKSCKRKRKWQPRLANYRPQEVLFQSLGKPPLFPQPAEAADIQCYGFLVSAGELARRMNTSLHHL